MLVPEKGQNNGKADEVWRIQGESQSGSYSDSDRRDGSIGSNLKHQSIGGSGEDRPWRTSGVNAKRESQLTGKIVIQLLIEYRSQISMKTAEIERLEAGVTHLEELLAAIESADSDE